MRISAVVFCFLLTFLGMASLRAENSVRQKHVEVSMRLIGHNLLQQVGDSSSRVLPIENEGNTHRIRFENEFGFQPEHLVDIVNRVMIQSDPNLSYIVEVEQCETREVVYSFEMADTTETDLLPCMGRPLPTDCYNVLVTLTENSGPEDAAGAVANIGDEPMTGGSNSAFLVTVIVIVALLLMLGVAFSRRRKQSYENSSNLIQIGDYYFDPIKMILHAGDGQVELTGKEAELLKVLYESPNSTVEREHILSAVWGDDGDYVGRTLDVFISKLRKKFEQNERVRFVNVRGVGYRMVVD